MEKVRASEIPFGDISKGRFIDVQSNRTVPFSKVVDYTFHHAYVEWKTTHIGTYANDDRDIGGTLELFEELTDLAKYIVISTDYIFREENLK